MLEWGLKSQNFQKKNLKLNCNFQNGVCVWGGGGGGGLVFKTKKCSLGCVVIFELHNVVMPVANYQTMRLPLCLPTITSNHDNHGTCQWNPSFSNSFKTPNNLKQKLINRGYYMAARGYKFYLRVLSVSLMSGHSEQVKATISTRR